MLKQLTKILAWSDESDSQKFINNSYLNYTESVFSVWLSRAHTLDGELGNSLCWQWECLPPQSHRRFLTAPETYRRLFHGGRDSVQENVGFVSESFCAERCLIKEEYLLTRSVWTALGDFFHPEGYVQSPTDAGARAWGWRPDTVYVAPHIAEEIVVDYISPRSQVALDLGPPEEITHSPQELELIHDRLKRSLAGIKEVCPATGDIIDLVVKVIAVKRDMVEGGGLSSSSWSSIIGRVVMTNAHLSVVSSAQLANALIHEAIHSLLYMLELIRPFCLDKASVSEFMVKSPWTGRVLYLSSYLHACFVWFGLWSFWRLSPHPSTFPEEEVDRCLTRSKVGFLQGSLIAPIQQIRGCLAPDLLDAIHLTQEAVLAIETR